MRLLPILALLLTLNCSAQTVDKKYVALNLAHLAAAIADVELTQHCIAKGTCREGNPLMPSARKWQYTMEAVGDVMRDYSGTAVTSTSTATAQVCAIAAVTPSAKTYNVTTY